MRLRATGVHRLAGALACVLALSGGSAVAQRGTAPKPEALPAALEMMADTEREFAKRALAVGWKEAFLEYYADDAA